MPLTTSTKYLSLLLYIATSLFSSTLTAAYALPEFNAKYTIEKYGINVAKANYQLRYTDTGYKFSQNTKLDGLASLFANDTVSATSLIDETAGNLLLTKHEYIQTGKEKNKNALFEILWDVETNSFAGTITGVVRSTKINLQTQTQVWDALSFQIPLMIEANDKIKEYPYQAILKGKIDTYNFILKATKKIKFAGIEYKALQLVRTDPHRNRQLHIWLLPELNNIPILIETYRKGKEDSRMLLNSVQFDNNKPLTEHAIDTSEDDEF